MEPPVGTLVFIPFFFADLALLAACTHIGHYVRTVWFNCRLAKFAMILGILLSKVFEIIIYFR
ncbi:hypothetical protein ATY27_09160 [Rheinheimera sp. F8]|nr:hypothetical protein ATY27_09160 [Rheinheimera sp. F8]